jgi:hypothetical protein
MSVAALVIALKSRKDVYKPVTMGSAALRATKVLHGLEAGMNVVSLVFHGVTLVDLIEGLADSKKLQESADNLLRRC